MGKLIEECLSWGSLEVEEMLPVDDFPSFITSQHDFENTQICIKIFLMLYILIFVDSCDRDID